MALSCSPEVFTRYTRLAFSLGEEQSTDWQYEPTSEGFRTFTQLSDASPRSLTVCQRSLATQLGHECVYPTASHSSKATEGYLAVIPTIQHGDQLGQPTQGYYYHFQHGKLIHEYKLMGESRCDFFLTRSTSDALSDELMTGQGQRAIAVFWLQNSNLAVSQHLVYWPEKLTDLNGVNQEWLDKHGLALDVLALIKAGQGNPQDNPRYHHLSDCTYDYPARYLHGTKIVALHQRHVEPGLPVVNLREENIFRIGVFFDGTGNNDDNDQIKEDRGDKSRTNVARLFAAYPYEQGKSAKIYVSGVGTLDFADPVQRKAMVESGEDEEKITQATGRNYLLGSSGAMFKWQSLLRQLRREIYRLGEGYNDITHVVFDVIGFSEVQHLVATL